MSNATYDPSPERAAGPPAPRAGEIDDAMRTGQGADDEPEMTIGDKHSGEAAPDPDGDGRLTVGEAAELLGGDDENSTGESASRVGTQATTE